MSNASTREWLLKKLIASELEQVSMKSAIECLEGQIEQLENELAQARGVISKHQERVEGDMLNAARLADYTSGKVFRVLERSTIEGELPDERTIIATQAGGGKVTLIIAPNA